MSRRYPTTTPLGALMQSCGFKVDEVAYMTGINGRTLSSYLAGRTRMLNQHLTLLCDLFEVEPEDMWYEVDRWGKAGVR